MTKPEPRKPTIADLNKALEWLYQNHPSIDRYYTGDWYSFTNPSDAINIPEPQHLMQKLNQPVPQSKRQKRRYRGKLRSN